MLRTILKLPARFKTVQMVLKPSGWFLKLSNSFQSRPDGFEAVGARNCGFNTVGLAGFEAVRSQPGTQINLWLCSCVMIKNSACRYADMHAKSLATYCTGAVLLQLLGRIYMYICMLSRHDERGRQTKLCARHALCPTQAICGGMPSQSRHGLP